GETRQVSCTETNESESLMRHRKHIDGVETVASAKARDEHGGNLTLAMRHPVYRRRDGMTGFGTERGNLLLRCKGRKPSGEHHEAESTDARRRGGVVRSSDEAAVMAVERRGHVIGFCLL